MTASTTVQRLLSIAFADVSKAQWISPSLIVASENRTSCTLLSSIISSSRSRHLRTTKTLIKIPHGYRLTTLIVLDCPVLNQGELSPMKAWLVTWEWDGDHRSSPKFTSLQRTCPSICRTSLCESNI